MSVFRLSSTKALAQVDRSCRSRIYQLLKDDRMWTIYHLGCATEQRVSYSVW